jgi:3-deoxy-D-manno-octulosonate 8-phosphate phosphatase KdsC-like HAD superfamily phosphatase
MQLKITLTLDDIDSGCLTDGQYVYTKSFIENKLREIADGLEASIVTMEIQ